MSLLANASDEAGNISPKTFAGRHFRSNEETKSNQGGRRGGFGEYGHDEAFEEEKQTCKGKGGKQAVFCGPLPASEDECRARQRYVLVSIFVCVMGSFLLYTRLPPLPNHGSPYCNACCPVWMESYGIILYSSTTRFEHVFWNLLLRPLPPHPPHMAAEGFSDMLLDTGEERAWLTSGGILSDIAALRRSQSALRAWTSGLQHLWRFLKGGLMDLYSKDLGRSVTTFRFTRAVPLLQDAGIRWTEGTEVDARMTFDDFDARMRGSNPDSRGLVYAVPPAVAEAQVGCSLTMRSVLPLCVGGVLVVFGGVRWRLVFDSVLPPCVLGAWFCFYCRVFFTTHFGAKCVHGIFLLCWIDLDHRMHRQTIRGIPMNSFLRHTSHSGKTECI